MANRIQLSELKKAIKFAEEVLEELKNDGKRKLKQWRISRALKKAYALLNSKNYTQEQVDKVTKLLYDAIRRDISIFWFYLFGILFAGSILFASYETYSFMRYWDRSHDIRPGDNVSNVVNVIYKESNIVSLYNLVTVPDSIGLNNPKQEFNISNNPNNMPRHLNYNVNYQININELNENISNLISKKYIRYRLTHYDAKDGIKTYEQIGNFADLTQNPDGSFKMYSGVQAKGHQTNFEVVIWISEDAPNSEQGRSYNFAFSVAAVVSAA